DSGFSDSNPNGESPVFANREHSSGLNEAQVRHLLSSLRYADKLLSEIDDVLTSASSPSPFGKYVIDFTPAQARMIRDYSARFRTQMKRILEGLRVEIPAADIAAVHAIRVHLMFIRIALQECSPEHLSGYGAVQERLAPELDGFSEELQGLLTQLESYLAQGPARDLSKRIEALAHSGARVGLLPELERIISGHGLVEFRSALAGIVERLSTDRFEIAVFGQVSSGKSSLLNHIIGSQVLPVGVNPITAVPTRIVYGAEPRLMVSFADGQTKTFDAGSIDDFATETHNPANEKGVTRLTLEYPSRSLRDGIVFVDTPGLGSLATAGAEQTRSYLPRCDLAVVLINSASPLGEGDIQLIGTVQASAIPARVLLSKIDLLRREEQRDVADYVSRQLRNQLGIEVPVHPVSIADGYQGLLDSWFQKEIEPLYAMHQQLRQESIQRKIGLLREAVERALQATLRQAESHASGVNAEAVRNAEKELRASAGHFAEAEKRCLDMSDDLRELPSAAVNWAAMRLTEYWSRGESGAEPEVVTRAVKEVGAEFGSRIVAVLQELAKRLAEGLGTAAGQPGEHEPAFAAELLAPIQETPQIDTGGIAPQVSRPWLSFLGAGITRALIRSRLETLAGDRLVVAFTSFSRSFLSWVRTVFAQMRTVFDSHAEAWRAQVQRQIGTKSISAEERGRIVADIAAINGSVGDLVTEDDVKEISA
ncbi:MAG TPA: dynamin family protein, partial [Candidatus Sulfotelmatobacter sp.]|nr:dynamin family protein [Candidatus Sulfotelmatobacter sp.]